MPGLLEPVLEGVRESDGSLPSFPEELQKISGALVSRKGLVNYLKSTGKRSAYEFDLSLRKTSGEVSPQEKARPVDDRGRALKKTALIAELEREWPTIEADLKEAARNGLKAARVDDRPGWYYVEEARQWAEARGKLRKSSGTLTGSPTFWPAKREHRLKG